MGGASGGDSVDVGLSGSIAICSLMKLSLADRVDFAGMSRMIEIK